MKQEKSCTSSFRHIECKTIVTNRCHPEEVLLTQVADKNPAAEPSLDCAGLSLKPPREASKKLTICLFLLNSEDTSLACIIVSARPA